MPQVLIIDDHPAVGEALSLLLSLQDIDSQWAPGPDEGLRMLQSHAFDLVIQDMNFTADTTSGEEGRRLFLDIRQRWPQVPIILLTAWTELASAVELVKGGAADYLAKPWDDRKLLTTVSNLLALGASQRALHEQQQARQLEVQALHRGGVQRVYLGNLRAGTHEIVAFFTGQGPHVRDYKRGTTLKFDKAGEPKYIELQIRDATKDASAEPTPAPAASRAG